MPADIILFDFDEKSACKKSKVSSPRGPELRVDVEETGSLRIYVNTFEAVKER